MVLVTLMPASCPAGLLALRMMRHYECAVFDVAQDRRARSHIDVVADFDRCDELRITSDHAVVADRCQMLVVTIVVHRNDTTSNVGLTANNRVAEITQMTRLAAMADPCLFRLDEIADSIMTFQVGALAQIRERPNFAFITDYAFFGTHAKLEMRPIADCHVPQPRRPLDQHARADAALAEDLHVRTNRCIAPDFDLGTDIGC